MTAAWLLRSARSRSGLSQRELARRAGTSQARISRIEKALEEPTFAQLGRLVAACGLELRASVEQRDDDLARTLADLARAAALSRFLTEVAIAS